QSGQSVRAGPHRGRRLVPATGRPPAGQPGQGGRGRGGRPRGPPAAARGRPAHRRGDRGRPAGGRRGPRRSATRAGGGPALAEVPDRGGAEARGTRSGGGTGPGGTHPHPRRLTYSYTWPQIMSSVRSAQVTARSGRTPRPDTESQSPSHPATPHSRYPAGSTLYQRVSVARTTPGGRRASTPREAYSSNGPSSAKSARSAIWDSTTASKSAYD